MTDVLVEHMKPGETYWYEGKKVQVVKTARGTMLVGRNEQQREYVQLTLMEIGSGDTHITRPRPGGRMTRVSEARTRYSEADANAPRKKR